MRYIITLLIVALIVGGWFYFQIFDTSPDHISSFCQIVLCVVGIVSAICVWGQIRNSAKIAEAKFVSEYADKYYSKEMCNYIRILVDFRDRKTPDAKSGLTSFIRQKEDFSFRTPENNRNERISFIPDYEIDIDPIVDEARRAVQSYFINAYELYSVGIISKEVLLSIIDKSAFCLYFDVIEPLMYLDNKEYVYRKFYHLMELGKDLYIKRKRDEAHYCWRKNGIFLS